EEGADAVLERPDHRYVDLAEVARIEPPDGPRLRRRIERADAHATKRSRRKIEDVVVHVTEPAEDRLHHARPVELDPLVRAREALFDTTMLHVPGTKEEIEVMRGRIAARGGGRRRGGKPARNQTRGSTEHRQLNGAAAIEIVVERH